MKGQGPDRQWASLFGARVDCKVVCGCDAIGPPLALIWFSL
jgi:hypothetical protein